LRFLRRNFLHRKSLFSQSDGNTIAVTNDNDFDSKESKFDAQGNNIGKGKRSQILILPLGKPLPVTLVADKS